MGSQRLRGLRLYGRARRASVALLTFLLAFMLIGPTALAVHDEGLFELDGDAESSAAAGDDWEAIEAGGGSAIATSFITDGTDPQDKTYLHTGDSKDIKDFDDWVLTTTDEAPDKDEIMHAFAAAYEADDGDFIVYFGLDRFDASGDAQVGFWFAQDAVSIAGGNVVGEHQVGDILVLSDFVNGGKVPDVRVFTWVGSGGSDGAIDEVTASGDADCSAAGAGDERCAIVNLADADAPWSFTDKSGKGYFLPGEFYEGGINLTELGIEVGCISTFIAESRTSQSTDARLKDVAMGAFPVCGIEVEKEGDSISKVGDQAHYEITVTNTGVVKLYKESIVDDILGDLTDGTDANITSSDCGASLDAGDSCTIELSYTVQQGDDDPLVNTVDVVYDSKANLTGSEVTSSDSHSLNLFQPSIVVDKTGDESAEVGDTVTYTFEITNTSSDDAPDLVMDSITDTLLGDLADDAPAACDTLASGESCSFTVGREVLEDDPDPLPNTVTVHYHPEGFPNDITDTDDHSVGLFEPSVVITKTGDEIGKVTDPVHYHFEIENTSSDDSPDLVLDSISDTLLGDLEDLANDAGCDFLAPGDTCEFDAERVVQAGDPDPLPNTVTVHYHPEGFAESDVQSSDDHSVNLFQPSVTVDKAGPATATVGQPLTYTFTINNTSSSDSPPLELESMTDVGTGWAGLGDLTDEAIAGGCETLAPGASCRFTVTITTPASPDPLDNTVSVLYHPEGFPNDITDTDDHSLALVQVLPRKILPKTGSDTGVLLAMGFAFVIAGLGLRFLVTVSEERA